MCVSITRALGRVERAGLVDDLGGDADLADVVQQRNELGVAPVARVRDAELVADGEHEVDDVAAVAAGVLVVGLDDVAEQEGGAAVRVAQLERVVDAVLALLAESTRSSPTSGSTSRTSSGCERVAKASTSPIGASAASTR